MSSNRKTFRLTDLSEEKLVKNCDRLNGMSQNQFLNGLIANYADYLWLTVDPKMPQAVQYLKR